MPGAKSTFLVIEHLTNRNNAVDVTFYDAISLAKRLQTVQWPNR